MAHLTTCRFCGRISTDHDHDKCAEAFFKGLNDQVMRWNLNHPGKLLPTDIAGKFTSEKYKWYLEYAARKNEALALQRKCNTTTQRIERKLQKIGDKMIKKVDTDLQIKVMCKVTLIPRSA